MASIEYLKQWRAANKDKVAAQARRYRAKHPDKVKAVKDAYLERSRDERLPKEAAQARARRAADPEGQRRRNQAYVERQRAERERLAGRPRPIHCDICGPAAIGQIVFDHSHAHGGFRGWLCDRCNKVLGLMKDNPQLLRGLAAYLEKDHEQALREAA